MNYILFGREGDEDEDVDKRRVEVGSGERRGWRCGMCKRIGKRLGDRRGTKEERRRES